MNSWGRVVTLFAMELPISTTDRSRKAGRVLEISIKDITSFIYPTMMKFCESEHFMALCGRELQDIHFVCKNFREKDCQLFESGL